MLFGGGRIPQIFRIFVGELEPLHLLRGTEGGHGSGEAVGGAEGGRAQTERSRSRVIQTECRRGTEDGAGSLEQACCGCCPTRPACRVGVGLCGKRWLVSSRRQAPRSASPTSSLPLLPFPSLRSFLPLLDPIVCQTLCFLAVGYPLMLSRSHPSLPWPIAPRPRLSLART